MWYTTAFEKVATQGYRFYQGCSYVPAIRAPEQDGDHRHQYPDHQQQRIVRLRPVKQHMMTSSNGNIFRVTGHLCGEFTGPGEFPAQRPVTRSFDVFFDLCLNKRLSTQSWGLWCETLSRPLWRHRNEPFCSCGSTTQWNAQTQKAIQSRFTAFLMMVTTLKNGQQNSHSSFRRWCTCVASHYSIYSSLKTKGCHNEEFVVTDGPLRCHNNNTRCHQGRQGCHYDSGWLIEACVSKLTIIGSDNGLSPGRCLAAV